ncbi:MAG: hypothetical protein R2911_31430 [Caldilineaceae bacterium]
MGELVTIARQSAAQNSGAHGAAALPIVIDDLGSGAPAVRLRPLAC